jgi:hypothetical protein
MWRGKDECRTSVGISPFSVLPSRGEEGLERKAKFIV